jgi:hypothetical protein
MSHHEQQASEGGDDEQHHDLWPAYIVNLESPQASTQGLFQQLRLFTEARKFTTRVG